MAQLEMRWTHVDPLHRRTCHQYKEPEGHQDLLDLLGLLDHEGFQVLLEEQEKKGTEVSQERRVSLVLQVFLVHQVLQEQILFLYPFGETFSILKRT